MKRKMLISIALITIMLLNCIMPLMVHADVSGEEIQLNSKLYKAIKSSLITQGLAFESDDITHTITLTEAQKANIKALNLNEGAISDITGIDAFNALTHLELSGNNLSGESNLAVLNNLPELNYLDLSTNQLDDVSEINPLISELQENGTIVLSGQTVTQVKSIYLDTTEESDLPSIATFDLPLILEHAGYIKSVWKNEKSYSEAEVPQESYNLTPYIESVPMYVTEEDKAVQVKISNDTYGYGYYGMVKLSIYIHDDATEAAQANNPNKAAENILNESRFDLYYVIHDGNSEAITTMDTNLYKAIKEQLTGGQYGKYINPDLSSYPYVVDADGNIVYEEFTYATQDIDGTTYRVLTEINTQEVTYALNPETGVVYAYDGTTIGNSIDTMVEEIEIKTSDDNGNITIKAGYRVAFKTDKTGKTLYIAAYDDAKTFVIDDLVLTNEITSLILNNRQIRDLSGIEYFVGLCSDLNVSHNYLSDIEPVYHLQTQKDHWEAQMIEEFRYWLNSRSYGNLQHYVSLAESAETGIEGNKAAVKAAVQGILNTLKEAAKLDTTAENYKEQLNGKVEALSNSMKLIQGYTDDNGNEVKGLMELLQENLSNQDNTGMADQIPYINSMIRKLYSIYNNMYKLTTLLADNLNYQVYSEYDAYVEATTGINATKDTAKALVNEQIQHLISLESANALSELDKRMLTVAFDVDFEDKDEPAPVAKRFGELLSKEAMNRIEAVQYLNVFREMGIYSEIANYCLIKRMTTETAEGYCYEQEYLENRMKELSYEDIPMELEESMLKAMKQEIDFGSIGNTYGRVVEVVDENGNVTSTVEYVTLGQIYDEYVNGYLTYGTDVYFCQGDYVPVDYIEADFTTYTIDELYEKVLGDEVGDTTLIDTAMAEAGITLDEIAKEIHLYEVINSTQGGADELFFYDQMMSLAKKILTGNVDRYVYLADLKKLDASYNADLDNLEGITVLTSLSDLNVAYCYIADLTNVDWELMTNLRKLNLAYNYISDLSPLTELTTLKSLNLSNNLLAGSLEITEQQYQKLFKKLEELDLSGNKISDITSLLIYLDYLTGGDYANYIAKEDTIDINLNNQNLVIEIKEPINLAEYPTTIDIELPKIFTQLLAIDVERTGFGENSQGGRIESEGTYVTLNTRTVGEKIGEVVVLPMSGNGQVFDTCVGNGTKATIKYKVVAGVVTGMTVTPEENASVKAGETLQFTATVEGENLATTKAVWSIEGNVSENTTISEDGLLTVAAEETAENIIVKVSPEADKSLVVTVNVAVIAADVEGTTPEGGEGTTPEGGEGTTPEGGEGTTPEGGEGTTPEGGEGSTPEGGEGSTEVDVIDTDTLGYAAGEEYLTEICPKTSVEDFATELLNGKQYNVVIKKDGETITEGNVATGMYVQVQDQNGNVIKDQNGDLVVFEIVVKGDVNGDGLANSLDSILIKAYRNEVTALSGSAFEAADINDDGTVNIADSKLLLYHRAEVKGYDLNYVK